MKKFTVHFMTPYCSWENVEAKDEDDAIRQCQVPAEFDANEPGSFLAVQTDDEEEDTTLKELDVVELLEENIVSRPAGISKGETGTIVHVHNADTYEVEFRDGIVLTLDISSLMKKE
jgi:hypothetical protein